jgi:hypothetical protein
MNGGFHQFVTEFAQYFYRPYTTQAALPEVATLTMDAIAESASRLS